MLAVERNTKRVERGMQFDSKGQGEAISNGASLKRIAWVVAVILSAVLPAHAQRAGDGRVPGADRSPGTADQKRVRSHAVPAKNSAHRE